MIYLPSPAVKLFVGSHASRVQGEAQDLTGARCFSAAHRPQVCKMDTNEIDGLLDSGAFTDPPEERLTPEQSLERQLAWEKRASEKWGGEWKASALVSYDRLIDETWVDGQKFKRRWTVQMAESAVRETIEAAHYLAARQRELYPRDLVLACQGVDDAQYAECVAEVLKVATVDDWIGLGGWCILGRFKRWMPTFLRTITRCIPLIAAAGVIRVHIFGVLYEPALAPLLWLCDEHGLRLSTDSSAPILNCTWKNKEKAGVRVACGKWRCNVSWWVNHLANLRQSQFYREPDVKAAQAVLWNDL
jgi:hypothetical protein